MTTELGTVFDTNIHVAGWAGVRLFAYFRSVRKSTGDWFRL